MDVTPYVEYVRRTTAEKVRRNAEAQARGRAILPRLVEVIRAYPGVKRAYLYGSLAKDLFHPKSDIDIAVEGLDMQGLCDLQQKLEAESPFVVDVRDLNSTPGFRKLVEFYGEPLHADS